MQDVPTLPHSPARGAPLSAWLIRLAYTFAFVGVIYLSLGVMGAAAFGLANHGLIYPGVRAWGLDLSGQTPAEAAVTLARAFDYPQSAAFTFRDGERSWTAAPAELGLSLNLPASIDAAYAVGRSGNPVADFASQFSAWYSSRQVSPVVVYDRGRLLAYLSQLAGQVSLPSLEAGLSVEAGQVTAVPGQIGREMDVAATAVAVEQALLRMEAADVALAFIEIPPQILDASAQAAAAQAILSEPLVLSVAEPLAGDPGPWSLDTAALGGMLQIRRVEDSPNAAHFEVGLDPAALRAFIEPLAPELERQPRNARFIFNDDTHQLDVLEPSVPERRLDVEASLAAIQSDLALGAHAVPLVFQSTPPAVTEAMTAAELGITDLVSQQSTYFRGSSAERVNNIKVAAARFHGLLVPPNAVFSFNEHLGDVSLDTGFAEALIIFGGRTIRGVGGGVCQVSTTIFRAAYFGGFPIVERYSHAYRVSYYERGDPGQWSGPGLDATVFAPLVDFKFQNDTPYWLLMEVYVSEASGRITWKFYSTSDGRQVVVGPADVRNVVPAPEPLYEEAAELKAGEIKQVDYAAEGADVFVRRTITRGGAVVNSGEPIMTTHYQPWRAIFHYGPGTEGMPPPAPTPTPTP